MRKRSRLHNSLAAISDLRMTGMSQQFLKPSLMALHGHCLWEELLVEAASSTGWSGIVVTRMITTPGNHLGTLTGLGQICYHISRRQAKNSLPRRIYTDFSIQSETFTPIYYEGVANQPVTFIAGGHGWAGPVSVSYPNYYWPQSGEYFP
jgi:hypothetical protein